MKKMSLKKVLGYGLCLIVPLLIAASNGLVIDGNGKCWQFMNLMRGAQIYSVNIATEAYAIEHGGAVSSVFGRTGTVTAQSGDYTASNVGADPSGTAATAVSTHNSAMDAHSDIRTALSLRALTADLGAFAYYSDAPSDGAPYGRKNGAWFDLSGSGTGDATGPSSSTDGNVALFNGITGKAIKDSGLALSGSNTGDETTSTIQTKLGTASTSTDGYLTSTDWNTFNGKQAALGFTPVANTGNETIADIKTFTSSPVVPTPTTDYQAATKKYVDDNAGGDISRTDIFINGTFAVWQRGTTSSAITTARTYLADRWAVKTGAGTLATVARSSTVPTASRSKYSLELTGAAGVTAVGIDQRIEAMDVPKGTVYFSAYVYNGSGAAFTPTLYVSTPSASDTWTSSTVRNGGGSGEALQECADSAWTKIYWTADISGYTDIANGVEFKLEIPSGSLVSGDTVRIADSALTYGNAYIEPAVKPYSQILAECQRYFITKGGTTTYELIGMGQATAAATAIIICHLPVTMRAAPSITVSSAGNFAISTSSGGVIAVSSFTGSNGSLSAPSINVSVSSGFTAGNATFLYANNSISARVYFNSEL